MARFLGLTYHQNRSEGPQLREFGLLTQFPLQPYSVFHMLSRQRDGGRENCLEGQLTHLLLLVVQIDDGQVVVVLLLSIYGHGDGSGIMQIRWTTAPAPTDEMDLVLVMVSGVVVSLLLLRQRVRRRRVAA